MIRPFRPVAFQAARHALTSVGCGCMRTFFFFFFFPSFGCLLSDPDEGVSRPVVNGSGIGCMVHKAAAAVVMVIVQCGIVAKAIDSERVYRKEGPRRSISLNTYIYIFSSMPFFLCGHVASAVNKSPGKNIYIFYRCI